MSEVSLHPNSLIAFIEKLSQAFEANDSAVKDKTAEAENVQRLQNSYRAIAQGNLAAVSEIMAEEIEMELIAPAGFPVAGSWRGREQVEEAMRNNFAHLEDQQAELMTVVAQGDHVVLFARELGRLRATQEPYSIHWTQCFTFRDGKIIRVHGLTVTIPPVG
jgi:ketosteroid isomerase-like protein